MVGVGLACPLDLQLYVYRGQGEFWGEEMKGYRDELRGRLRTIREQLHLGLDHLQKEGRKSLPTDKGTVRRTLGDPDGDRAIPIPRHDVGLILRSV